MSQDDVFSISLIDIVSFVKRRFKKILLAGFIGAFLAGSVAFLMEPIYRAETTILIKPKQVNTIETIALAPGQGDTFAVDSEALVLKSPALLNFVAQKENLINRSDFYKTSPSLMTSLGILLGIHKAPHEVSFNQKIANNQAEAANEDKKNVKSSVAESENNLLPAQSMQAETSMLQDILEFIFPAPLPQTRELVEHKILEILQENLIVQRKGRSYIIQVSYDSPNPILAAKIVNRIANEYLNNQRRLKQKSTQDASKWLDKRLSTLQKELDTKESAIAAFKERHNLYGATGVTQIERQLTRLNEQLVTARVDTAEKYARYKQVQSLKKSGTLQSYTNFINSGTVSNLRLQEAKVFEELTDLSTRYGEQHPKLINARAKLKNIQKQINNEADRMIANARSEYRIALGRENALAGNIASLKRKFDATGSQAIRLQKLEREAETAKTAYNTVAENFRKTDNTDKIQESDAQIISPAIAPIDPIKPKKAIFVLAGLILGILVGIGLLLVRQLLIKGFIDPAQIEKETDLKVLASINYLTPKMLRLNGQQLSIGEYLIKKPLTIFADAIYRMRTAVEVNVRTSQLANQQVNDKDLAQVIMMTSSISGEGKSTLSLSYAISSAKAGKKVMLIDTDFRRPILTNNVLPDIKVGLLDYLSDKNMSDTNNLINKINFHDISFIGTKEYQLQETDLFKQDKFKNLIADLRHEYDLIMIDTPPISAVIDGCVIAETADHVLYTVAWGNTPKEAVINSLNEFPEDIQAKIAGIVFNKVQLTKAEQYGVYQNYKYSSNYYTKEG